MLQNSTHTKKKFKCHLVKNNDILDQKSYPCFSNGWKGKLASIAMRLSNIAKEKKTIFNLCSVMLKTFLILRLGVLYSLMQL